MIYLTICIIAVGLSLDAFTASITYGSKGKLLKKKHFLIISGSFGLAQGVMPLFGWFLGTFFEARIKTVDHWIAFGLLTAIGIKMIFEYFQPEEKDENLNQLILHPRKLLFLSIATSIDALAVGISFAFLGYPILTSAIIIALITFVLCYIGVKAGCFFHYLFGKKMEIAGGIVLIGMGIKILLKHTLLLHY